jgi:hypothetical protein
VNLEICLQRFGFAAFLVALCCQPAAAQSSLSEKLVAKQKWTMSAPRGQQPPDCVETWTFGANGQMIVQSGSETVTQQWRVDAEKGPVSLYLRRLSSTGGADCLNTENAAVTEPESDEGSPLWVLEFNSGDALYLCNPHYVTDKKTKKQTPLFGDEACWGELKPTQ